MEKIKIKEKPVIFKNKRGEKLWGVITLPRKRGEMPAVIIAHGFYGSKSNRKFVKIGRRFAQNGIAVLRFDFSGCGDSEGNFQNMGIFQETEDLKAAYNFLKKQPKIDKKRIGFLGYSLGALVVCLFQAKTSIAKTLVLVAPALNQENLLKIWLTKKQIRKWQKEKFLDTPKCRIGIRYFNEAKNYNFITSQIKIPVLIIHGNKDEDVPVKFSKELFKFFLAKKKMIIIRGADHNFEGYKALKELIKLSLNWFRKTL